MYFTEGKDREYERMMRQIPGFDREGGDGDCPYCLHYHEKKKKCRLKRCAIDGEKTSRAR